MVFVEGVLKVPECLEDSNMTLLQHFALAFYDWWTMQQRDVDPSLTILQYIQVCEKELDCIRSVLDFPKSMADLCHVLGPSFHTNIKDRKMRFNMCMACDEDPKEVLKDIQQNSAGIAQIYLSKLQVPSTCQPFWITFSHQNQNEEDLAMKMNHYFQQVHEGKVKLLDYLITPGEGEPLHSI